LADVPPPGWGGQRAQAIGRTQPTIHWRPVPPLAWPASVDRVSLRGLSPAKPLVYPASGPWCSTVPAGAAGYTPSAAGQAPARTDSRRVRGAQGGSAGRPSDPTSVGQAAKDLSVTEGSPSAAGVHRPPRALGKPSRARQWPRALLRPPAFTGPPLWIGWLTVRPPRVPGRAPRTGWRLRFSSPPAVGVRPSPRWTVWQPDKPAGRGRRRRRCRW